jgi:hypothetical protein
MPWRVQFRAKYGRELENEFARIFKGLPELGKGAALVEKETEIVLTTLVESEKELETIRQEAPARFAKLGLKIEISVKEA